MLKWSMLVLLTLSTRSFAAMPIDRLDYSPRPSAAQIFQSRFGIQLSPKQKQKLETLMNDDAELIDISDRGPSVSIYCVGYRVAWGVEVASAACVNFHTFQTYELDAAGMGLSFGLNGSVFKLTVTYDPTRYDEKFDPIPGQYGYVSGSWTLAFGEVEFSGDSGNKRMKGSGLNAIGTSVDLASGGLLNIKPN